MISWLSFILVATAGPYTFESPEVNDMGVWTPRVTFTEPGGSEGELDLALEEMAAQAPDETVSIRPEVFTPDGWVPLETLLPPIEPVVRKEPILPERAITHVGRAEGALSGKALYLSQCHGYQWASGVSGFTTQRGNVFDTVEDFHNPEGMNYFLTTYLENAGGAVFTVKERDHNKTWAVVDDGDSAYTESGTDFTDGPAGYFHDEYWAYGENPFGTGTTRRFRGGTDAKASWTLTAPDTGHFALYVSWDSAADQSSAAQYRVSWAGGVLERTFDQTVHGSTWQFFDTLPVQSGDAVTVELLGEGSSSTAWLSADAVRLGGGTGVVSRVGDLTGRPRWEEAAVLATQYNGAPTSIYDPYGDGYNGSDPATRSRWAAWEHPEGEDALYLSWHSNATSSGSARGTVTYIYEGSQGPAVDGSEALAWAVQDEMVSAFQTLWETDWYDRGVKRAAFAEVNPGHNREMPAALVELAFHDNEIDVEYLKHPLFRVDASRAMYRGIVKYFAERDGLTPTFLPEPPTQLALQNTGEGLVLSWQPGQIGSPFGDAPTSYLVQTSRDGFYWTTETPTTANELLLDTQINEAVYARVVAMNDGGRSFTSEVVSGLRSADGSPAVLIVDAFDRFATGQLAWTDTTPRVGEVLRMEPDRINPQSIITPHARAVAEMGWPFDSVSDESLETLELSKYAVIIWATGEESTVDETVSSSQQALLSDYWQNGGRLFVSGAEVFWDLDEKGSAADQQFALDVLGSSLESDNAQTTDAFGVGIAEGLDLSFPDATSPYPIEWPDVLNTSRDVFAQYSDNRIAGSIGEGVAVLGFPFESIGIESDRHALMRILLVSLAPEYTPPVVDEEEPGTPSEETPAGGCACSSLSSLAGSGFYSLLLFPLLGVRRNRRAG